MGVVGALDDEIRETSIGRLGFRELRIHAGCHHDVVIGSVGLEPQLGPPTRRSCPNRNIVCTNCRTIQVPGPQGVRSRWP
jgi:hypothetical protein